MQKLIAALAKQTRWHGSQVAEQHRSVQQEDLFDNIARLAASDLPRRKVLKLIVIGFAAAVLARIGIKPSQAQAAINCTCNGGAYDPSAQCCTPSGVQNKHPIANLNACPNRGPRPGYTASFNGCGPDGSVLTVILPQRVGYADFQVCCNGHDVCYGTCLNNKIDCDSPFLACLSALCQDAYQGLPQPIQAFLTQQCRTAASVYYLAVQKGGDNAYNAAQRTACDCCAGGAVSCGIDGNGCCPPGFTCCPGAGLCCEVCCGSSNDPAGFSCCVAGGTCCLGPILSGPNQGKLGTGCCPPGGHCVPGIGCMAN